MVQITVTKQIDRYGRNVTFYKKGHQIMTKILETESKVFVYISKAGLRFSYDDIKRAKDKTELFLNNFYSFAGGVELIYK